MSESEVDPAPLQTSAQAPNSLTAARLAAGLSVGDVARQLKLSVSQVEALESGDYAQLPGTVFVRGFLRNYARLLKLDPAPLLQNTVAPEPVVVAVSSERRPVNGVPFPVQRTFNWKPYALVILIVAAGLVGYEFYGDEIGPIAGNTFSVDLPQPKTVNDTPSAEKLNTVPPVAAVESVPEVVNDPAVSKPSSVAKQAVPVATPLPTTDSRPTTVTSAPENRTIRMTFSRDSWVEVRDRKGTIIFSQMNPSGSAHAVSGRRPFRLVIGNAGGVRIVYDDRTVDLAPYTQVDVARLTLE